jgi:DNA-binding transcriptional MerR regulator
MLTISKLAKRFGLSRATVLYYEREGLLEPASRAANGYRYYGDREVERLQQIAGFRSYGVPVRDIRELLAKKGDQAHEQILRKRFAQMESEIQDLRRQQKDLLAILEQREESPQPAMSKERWSGIMSAAGMSNEDMHNWHREFEAREPLAHQEFLESLNLDSDEIGRIRQWSQLSSNMVRRPRMSE